MHRKCRDIFNGEVQRGFINLESDPFSAWHDTRSPVTPTSLSQWFLGRISLGEGTTKDVCNKLGKYSLHFVSRMAEQVMDFVHQNFQQGVLREKRGPKMRFDFSQQANWSLGDIFGFLEVRSGWSGLSRWDERSAVGN